METLLFICVVIQSLCLVLLVFGLVRSRSHGATYEQVTELARQAREETMRESRLQRDELARGQREANEILSKTLAGLSDVQRSQLDSLANQFRGISETTAAGLERVRATVDGRLAELQESNSKRLDEMRKTVDEQLQTALERRLTESFRQVSERLEAVHKGLGEMQSLAVGVGDLKRVLTNVKARGTWGEVQLGALLEQVLAPGQFSRNVHVLADSPEVVEFAVRLPGPNHDMSQPVWLPIDSKFPQEDWLRLQEAQERGDVAEVNRCVDALNKAIRSCAKDINSKYIHPPASTDFGILFLATEGLYAEALRDPALAMELQQKYRVVLAGPTTLTALLSSLALGFQTLAIEQRAAEVRRVLGTVKSEFGKFHEVLDKVKKHLETASRTIDQTAVRTRAMERHLRSVEAVDGPIEIDPALPQGEPDESQGSNETTSG